MKQCKALKHLAFQFSDLLTVPRLDAYEIYDILSAEELIEGVAFAAPYCADLPTHYRECFGARMPYEDLLEMIQTVLYDHCKKHGYECKRAEINYSKRVSR